MAAIIVADGTSSTQLAPASTGRTGLSIFNRSAEPLFLAHNATAVVGAGVAVQPGTTWTMPNPPWTGVVNGIWRNDSNGAAEVYDTLDFPFDADLPTVAVAQTVARNSPLANAGIVTAGREHMCLIWLNAGQVISSITWWSGTTAANTPTNQWFSLRTSARVLLQVTGDDLTAAWNANTAKTLTLASPYLVPTSGLYYVGMMVAGTTAPTLLAANGIAGINTVVPITDGNDNTNTGLTTPGTAPATSAALTVTGSKPYVYVS